MADLLSEASEKLGVPERLLQRSSAARAAEEGVSQEDVLAAWVAGEEVEAGAAPEPEEASAEEAAPEEVEEAEPEEEPKPEPAPAPAVPERPAAPEPVPAASPVVTAEEEDLVTVVGTAGLRERREVAVPNWLLVAFLVIPLYAMFYAVVYAGGPSCGDAGRLAFDPETGALLNCDGSAYTATGAGGPGGDFLAQGRNLYNSAPAICWSCHGRAGQGGTGPAFSGGAVIETFPDCETHVEWVRLGTRNWPEPTYGAQDKPVGGVGVMPPFQGTLTEEEIRTVTLFERVQFGGQAAEEALVECGLVEAEEQTTTTTSLDGTGGATTPTTGGEGTTTSTTGG